MDYEKAIDEAQEASIALSNKLQEIIKLKDDIFKFSYDVPIEVLELSTFTNNILKSNGIYKVIQLVQLTGADLIEIGFSNRKILHRIFISLYFNGYHYKGSK